MVTLMKVPDAILFDLNNTLLDGRDLQQAVRQTCDALAAIRSDLDGDRLFAANQAI